MKKITIWLLTLALCLTQTLGYARAAEVADLVSDTKGTTVLFLDWDDRLIGSLLVGEDDVRAQVNAYVEENMIHPELRTVPILEDELGGVLPDFSAVSDVTPESSDPAQRYKAILDSNDREWTYRGEYPYVLGGPSSQARGSAHAEPGEKYPLTNKLDYVFYRHINITTPHEYLDAAGQTATDRYITTNPVSSNADAARYPWVYGWAIVEGCSSTEKWSATVDMARAPSIWTTFGTAGELFKMDPSYDYATDPDTHNLPTTNTETSSPAFFTVAERPTKYAYKLSSVDKNGYLKFADFSDLRSNLTRQGQNILIVKAVYEPGTELQDANYRLSNISYNRLDGQAESAYTVNITLERANNLLADGFVRGCIRVRDPAIAQISIFPLNLK